jgi:hypothetical protein
MTGSPRAARMITRALIAALEETAEAGDITNLRLIVNKLVGKAAGGDLPAIREIFDRVDGKAVAAAVADDGEQLTFEWSGK